MVKVDWKETVQKLRNKLMNISIFPVLPTARQCARSVLTLDIQLLDFSLALRLANILHLILYALEHPEFRCDLIHVDGGHFGTIPVQDMVNVVALSREDGKTIILLDDATCEIQKRDHIAGCIAPQDAWKLMKDIKSVNEDHCVRLSNTRGYCV
eukprot:gene33397-41212_t